jgi:hypothetical protein
MTGLPGRRPRVKLSGDEILRRLRLGDLRKLFADRCRGLILPDDDAGREYLRDLLLPISMGPNEALSGSGGVVGIWGPTDRMRREIELWAPWMSEDDAEDLITEINLTPIWERKPTKGALGERLQLTYAERARLQIRTIGPCDMMGAAMALIRKQKRRKRERLRRQSRGAKSRAEYLANSLSQTKPWEQGGISRRTWERRRVASPCPINLTKTERRLASSKASEVPNATSLCVRSSTATPAGQVQTYANLWAEEAVWQSTWERLEAAA